MQETAMPWSSANELFLTFDQIQYLKALNERDAEIAKSLVGRNSSQDKPSLLFRILRRLYFEAKQLTRHLFRNLFVSFLSRLFRIIVSSRTVPEGTTNLDNDFSIEIYSLQFPGLRERLEQSSSDYFVLSREPGQLLWSALRAIRSSVATSTAKVWFGDSRTQNGVLSRRPKFNKLLLRQVDALGPVIVAQRQILEQIPEEISPILWPLYLGMTLPEIDIELIPKVLSVGKPTSIYLLGHTSEANDIVSKEMKREGIRGEIKSNEYGRRSITYIPKDFPLVSIIIPTRGTASSESSSYIFDAVNSIINKSTYSNFEIVIVADNPTPQEVVDQIEKVAHEKVKWVRWTEEFNFSQKMNLGVAASSGKIVLFLNDDVEIVSPDWIESMYSLIGIDSIGYVGALLFFEDQTIQHAGHFYKGGAGHIGFGQPLQLNSSDEQLTLDRITSGVTAACSMITKQLFTSVGGFSPDFPGNFNDVDLGLKIRQTGKQIAVSGKARLYHFESKTRDASVKKTELLALQSRWKSEITEDQFFREIDN